MGDLKCGVIGLNNRGTLAYEAHKPGEGSRLVAGCDIRPEHFTQFKEKTDENVFTTTDYHELIDHPEVEAVFITAPDFLHEEMAVYALEKGKPVYCEKPVAISIESADAMLRAAYNNKSKLFVGHNMRYMSFVHQMKDIIDSGAIGELTMCWVRHFINYGGDAYFKDWHAERRYSHGLLLQKGAHDIDIIHWLAGGYTTRVTAMGKLAVYNKCHTAGPDSPWPVSYSDFKPEHWPPLKQKNFNAKMDVEDQSMILMQLNNGVQASYQQCHYSAESWRNYTFIGTAGRLENIGDYHGECVIRVWNYRHPFREKGDIEYIVPPSLGDHGGGDTRIVAEFINYVKNGGPTAANAVAARNSVAAGVQATNSLRQGSIPLDIAPVPEEIVKYFS